MTSETNPFNIDYDHLSRFARESTLQQGLDYFKQNRVINHWSEEGTLEGSVEGSRVDEPYSPRVFATNGELSCECDCAHGDGLCKHAVALLLDYSQWQQQSDGWMSARDQALAERLQRAKTEVKVELKKGSHWFGHWEASSVRSTTHHQRSYRVRIRAHKQPLNDCSCPDFATNQLGTCKHIEAVLYQICKRSGYKKQRHLTPLPFIYLNHDQNPPQVMIHNPGKVDEDLQPLIMRLFRADGRFSGRFPDDLFELMQIGTSYDLEVATDLVDYTRQRGEQAARELRVSRLSEQLRAMQGQIPGIRARLYPYQIEGVAFLAGNGRALLADDMGLGKTLQAISAATLLMQQQECRTVLLITPASLKHQWAREIERFSSHKATIIQGKADQRLQQYRHGEGIVIANYELVLRDMTTINRELCPDLIIIDEAQRLKNWRTKIASTIKLINSRYAFVLSGTPLENRLEDLYSLMQIVDPRILEPLWRYMVDFHICDERGKVLGYRNLSELRRRIKPVMLRRNRSLVADQLPERVQSRIDVSMSDAQLDLHGSALQSAGQLAQIAKQRPLTPSESNRLMSNLQQARMACNSVGLIDKESEESPKIDELCQILEQYCLQQGRKAVVFSQWERMTAMIEQRLKGIGMGSVRLHGGVPTNKRGDLMGRFHQNDNIQVFISTDAGGVGLNLQNATVLINVDIPWNPAVLEQRIARIHRLGQRESVQVILLIAAGSYEERVYQLVKGKQHLFDHVIDSDASEDNIGVSRRMLDLISEDLTQDTPTTPTAGEKAVGVSSDQDSDPEVAADTSPEISPLLQGIESDAEISAIIATLQQHLGQRLEQIIGTAGGLMVVVDQNDGESAQLASELSQRYPVALIDRTTLAGLQRLGVAPESETGTIHYQQASVQMEADSPLIIKARKNLNGARQLLHNECDDGVIDLLIGALKNLIAYHAELNTPPEREQLGVLVYSQLIPQGRLSADAGATIMRALGLALASEIPLPLLETLQEEIERMVASAAE